MVYDGEGWWKLFCFSILVNKNERKDPEQTIFLHIFTNVTYRVIFWYTLNVCVTFCMLFKFIFIHSFISKFGVYFVDNYSFWMLLVFFLFFFSIYNFTNYINTLNILLHCAFYAALCTALTLFSHQLISVTLKNMEVHIVSPCSILIISLSREDSVFWGLFHFLLTAHTNWKNCLIMATIKYCVQYDTWNVLQFYSSPGMLWKFLLY